MSKRAKKDSSLNLLFHLYKKYISNTQKTLLIAIFCMLVIAGITCYQVFLLGAAIDSIFILHESMAAIAFPIFFMIVSLVKSVATFFERCVMQKLAHKLFTKMQLDLYSHLVKADMKSLNEYPADKLISRSVNSINTICNTAVDLFSIFLKESLIIFALLTLMLFQSVTLTAYAIILFLLVFYPITFLRTRMEKIAKKMHEVKMKFTSQLDSTFDNISVVKSYCREDYEISRAKKLINKFYKICSKAVMSEAISLPIIEIIGAFVVAITIFFAGLEILTLTSFIVLIAAAFCIYRSLKSINNLKSKSQIFLKTSQNLFAIFEDHPEIVDDSSQPAIKLKKFDIIFDNVSFSYRGAEKILTDINIQIPHGKTVVLLGESGGGKSTILNLIQRIYDVDSGKILIDGTDIRDIRLQSLRDCFSIVNQNVALFDGTVKENIAYGKLDATDEEVISAAMAAAAHDFICELPQGYETDIGKEGLQLSSCHRAAIAIARAILKDAPVLLLDEATSSLDTDSQQKVQMALDYLKKDRTTIVIARCLKTIKNADYIYMIDNHRIRLYEPK